MKNKKYIMPFLTIFFLLAIDAFIVARLEDSKYLTDFTNIPKFTTKDINGNIVTEDIFKGNFTVVCLWVTKDAEGSRKLLSELYDWQKNSDKTFQIVGIAGDIRDNSSEEQIEKARLICKNIDILQIKVNDDLTELLTPIRNAPTVFFTDENGFIVGQPVIGNESELIKKEVNRLTEKKSPWGKTKETAQRDIFYSP